MGCGRTLREFWATVEAQEHHRLLATKVSTWLLPNSPIRLSWDIFIFTAICYTSLVTPVRMFIMSGDSTPSSLIHVDVAFDFVFAIDTILHFYRPYVDTNTGETVADLRAMREKYLRSATFYINAIACIPLLKAPLSSVLRRQVLENVTIYFNVLRMVRILHLPSQFQELKRFCMSSECGSFFFSLC